MNTSEDNAGVVRLQARQGVGQTVDRLEGLLKERGY